LIKYLGSKRRLVDDIVGITRSLRDTGSVVDLFSGTSRVGHALKREGIRVIANDYAAYAHVLATCYVQADAEDWSAGATELISELSAVPPERGYVTETFCEEARFFTPENGARIDAIRTEIAERDLPAELEAIALVSLMEAADRVDSTTGVQMAFLKGWSPRASNDLELRLPALLPQAGAGKGAAHRMDAMEASSLLSGDVAYLDPPYNQHSYLANYHIWETLVRWDAPPAYGVARKRLDTRVRKSEFNATRRHEAAMRTVVDSLDAAVLIVSFNDEGYLSREALTDMLSGRGEVRVFEYRSRRYIGAQIGVFNRKGKRVGQAGKLYNKELLFVAGAPQVVSQVEAGVGAPGPG